MTPTSRGLNFHLGIEHVDNTVSTPDVWARFTEDNIRRSNTERAQSDEAMNTADNLMKETSADMWNQFNTVNEAFEQRVHETAHAKDKIQNHLAAVIQEIFDLEKSIEFIKKCILDKVLFFSLFSEFIWIIWIWSIFELDSIILGDVSEAGAVETGDAHASTGHWVGARSGHASFGAGDAWLACNDFGFEE